MAENTPYIAKGGSFTVPGVSTIKILGGNGEKQALKVDNITGPGDDGAVMFLEGNYRYGFSGRGIYVEGTSASATLDDGVRGDAVVAFGNGETWSGTAILTRVAASVDWGPGGSIGVVLQMLFSGAVVVTQPSEV